MDTEVDSSKLACTTMDKNDNGPVSNQANYYYSCSTEVTYLISTDKNEDHNMAITAS